jgi:hypothetical protein
MKTAYFLTDAEAETLLGFVAELLDDKSQIDNGAREMLDGVYKTLSEAWL